MGLGKFFSALIKPFKLLFSNAGRKRVEDILKEVEGITELAFGIVEQIALATPDRSDDQIIAIAHNYGINIIEFLKTSTKEDALRFIARQALKSQFKEGSVRDKVINLAIEAAVILLEGKKDSK